MRNAVIVCRVIALSNVYVTWLSQFLVDMVCSGCGHTFLDHKSVTQSMHYCNKCEKLESYVIFSEKEKAEIPPSGPGEMLSKYFKTAEQ